MKYCVDVETSTWDRDPDSLATSFDVFDAFGLETQIEPVGTNND